jgi:hypothetical protein
VSAPDLGLPIALTVYAKRRAAENFDVDSACLPVPGMEADSFVVFAGASLPLRELVHNLHTLADHLDLGLADGPADRFEVWRDREGA